MEVVTLEVALTVAVTEDDGVSVTVTLGLVLDEADAEALHEMGGEHNIGGT